MSVAKAAAIFNGLNTPCTWNPTDLDASVTLSNSNLTMTSAAGGYRGSSGWQGRTTGKWYWEFLTGASFGGFSGGGFLKSGSSRTTYGGSGGSGIILYASGSVWNGSSQGGAGIGTLGTAQVVGMASDLDNNLNWYTKDGVTWSFSGAPASGTGGKAGGWTPGDIVKPVVVLQANGHIVTGRFRAANFTLTPPTGFNPWKP